MAEKRKRPVGQCANCNQERPIIGGGYCRACYMTAYRQEKAAVFGSHHVVNQRRHRMHQQRAIKIFARWLPELDFLEHSEMLELEKIAAIKSFVTPQIKLLAARLEAEIQRVINPTTPQTWDDPESEEDGAQRKQ